MKRLIVISIIVLAVLLSLVLFMRFIRPAKHAAIKLRPGDSAAPFVIGYGDSKPVNLTDVVGKYVIVLSFKDGGQESDKLDLIMNKKLKYIMSLNNGFLWFDISIREGRALIEEKTSRFKTHYLAMPEDIPAVYGLTIFPSIFVIDRDGVIKMIYRGYSPTVASDIAAAIYGR
jgi:hypothetical protein